MSGGSYNYLCDRTDDLSGRLYDLRRMRTRLTQLGYGDVSAQTDRVIELLKEAADVASELASIWHAVEWLDSFDYEPEQVAEAVERYRNSRNSTTST